MVDALVVAVRLEVPRESDEARCARPFDIIASDVDVLFEVKPEGKVRSMLGPRKLQER